MEDSFVDLLRSVINDTELTALLRESVVNAFGADHVETIERPSMGSEDFAFYATHIPAAMMRVGCRSDRVPGALLHTPQFDIDEEVLRVGARVLAEAAIRWLAQRETGDRSAAEVDAG